MSSIFTRRSVRQYQDKKVEAEKVDRILRAAMQAPSAVNQQPWEFIVIDDKATIEKTAQFSPYAKMLLEAPLAVIILEKQNMRAAAFTQQDLGACTQNLLLQIVEEGLGACWMGVSTGDAREKFLCEMFSIPEDVKPFAVISIGYPADENANRFVDRYDESRVHYNKY